MADNFVPKSEEFRIVAEQWVDAEAAANILEETKSALLAKKVVELGNIPVSRAEMIVKASEDWHNFLTSMVEARNKATRLKISLEYIRMQFHEWQSLEATRRAEMKL